MMCPLLVTNSPFMFTLQPDEAVVIRVVGSNICGLLLLSVAYMHVCIRRWHFLW